MELVLKTNLLCFCSLLPYESPAKEPLLAGVSDDDNLNEKVEEKEQSDEKVNLQNYSKFSTSFCFCLTTSV